MRVYKQYKTIMSPVPNAAMYVEDGKTISFLFDDTNTDYQEYLKWLAEGNEPQPAEGTE